MLALLLACTGPEPADTSGDDPSHTADTGAPDDTSGPDDTGDTDDSAATTDPCGTPVEEDCAPEDDAVGPLRAEHLGDGVDQDCDGDDEHARWWTFNPPSALGLVGPRAAHAERGLALGFGWTERQGLPEGGVARLDRACPGAPPNLAWNTLADAKQGSLGLVELVGFDDRTVLGLGTVDSKYAGMNMLEFEVGTPSRSSTWFLYQGRPFTSLTLLAGDSLLGAAMDGEGGLLVVMEDAGGGDDDSATAYGQPGTVTAPSPDGTGVYTADPAQDGGGFVAYGWDSRQGLVLEEPVAWDTPAVRDLAAVREGGRGLMVTAYSAGGVELVEGETRTTVTTDAASRVRAAVGGDGVAMVLTLSAEGALRLYAEDEAWAPRALDPGLGCVDELDVARDQDGLVLVAARCGSTAVWSAFTLPG